MLPSSLWQKELAETIANRRSMMVKLVFPLTIGGCYLLAISPGFYTATVITLLATFVGCLGTGITLSKTRANGMLRRLALTPLSPTRIVLEQLSINSTVAMCQLLPLAVVFAVRFGIYDARIVAILLAMAAAVAATNLIGLIASLFAKSPGEAVLYSSMALVPLLYLAGVFSPMGTNLDFRSFLAAGIPYSYLQQALVAAMGEVPLWPGRLVAEYSTAAIVVVGVISATLAQYAVRADS